MPWAKLDDGYLTHPKALQAGIEGRALHIAAILYSSRELTDGRIESSMVAALGGLAGVRHPVKVAEQLVGIRLFDRSGDGFVVHDYLKYNPSREQVLAERAAKKAAGLKGAHNRWHSDSQAPATADEMAPAMAEPMADAMAPPIANGWQNDAPVPHTPILSSNEERDAPHGKRLAGPKKTHPTDQWAEEMRERYHLKDFDETLSFFMNGSYYRGCADKCGYLEKKLAAAAEREAGVVAKPAARPSDDWLPEVQLPADYRRAQ